MEIAFTSSRIVRQRPAVVKENQNSLIQLTPNEQQLFTTLNAVAEQTQSTLRVSGGWVRDKILNRPSTDLDIAVDNMTGEAFAKKVYESVYGNQKQVHTIKANPDKSKHLETACINLFGLDIDLVNLRNETYTENSRIPNQIELGTPEEDAFRRDLTINTFFYNIKHQTIEDLTGFAFEDLQNKIARTPLPPLQTFLDDPLRILRTIRFSARFDLQISQDIYEAAANQEVRKMLAFKISKERIGKELSLMLSNENFKECASLFIKMDLYDIVFQFPYMQLNEQFLETYKNQIYQGLVLCNQVCSNYISVLKANNQ